MVESAAHGPGDVKRLSRPEAVRLLKTAVNGGGGGGANADTTRGGNFTARSGGDSNTARGRRGGSNTARGDRSSSSQIVSKSQGGGPMRVTDSVSILQLRREYEDKLEREKLAIKKRELELEEEARRAEKTAHRDAVNETTRGLTKLRQQQKRQLHAHNQMHQAAENEKMAAEARAVHVAAQQREEMARTKAQTKADVEAKSAQEMKAAEERYEEQMRRQAEQLNAAAERKLDEANELKRRETVRAEKLQKELDAAKADAKAARVQLERSRKEKEEALREAATKALHEKNAAIQAEKDKAETARRTALQAEAVRAEVVNLRSKQADDITALATQALKVAEVEKAKAEATWRQAEAQRKSHESAREEAELLRDEGRAQVEKAQRVMEEANEKVEKMSHAMTLQKAALDAVRQSADAEKVALMKAAEEAKAAALMAVAEERAAEKAAAEAEKAARAASAALAKRLGVSRSAYTPPPEEDEELQADLAAVAGAAAQQPLAGATVAFVHPSAEAQVATHEGDLPTFGGSPIGEHELEQMSQQIEAALASAAEEAKLAAAAEEHVAVLQERIAQLENELAVYSSEHAKQMAKLERRRVKALATARAERGAALRRLRVAYATRLAVEPMPDTAIKQALQIAGSKVSSKAIRNADEAMQPQAYVGVVAAVRIPSLLAITAGFGADKSGSEPEAVHVLVQSADSGAGSRDSLVSSATGVAVSASSIADDDDWVIKYVFDEDQVSSTGQKEVTITSKEGIVLSRFLVELLARPSGIIPTKRYEYDSAAPAATQVQAIARGRSARALKTTRAKETAAATKLQAMGRGSAVRRRREADDQFDAFPSGQSEQVPVVAWQHAIPDQQVYFVNTRKPLICRIKPEINSARVGEISPDTKVVVTQVHTLPDGSQRAQVQKLGQDSPFGWLTMTKDGASSLAPVE